MKKIVTLAVAGLILGMPWAAHAKTNSNFTRESTPSPAAAPAAPATVVSTPAASQPFDAKQHEEMKKKLEEKKKELNGSEWKVDLSSGAKKEGEDVLTFQNGQVKSKYFSDKGFPASNYTITLPEGSDTATWETMQTHPKGNVVFMRGEWKEKTMRGVISEQLEEGKSMDHNFASTVVESIPATTEKPKEEEGVQTADTTVGSDSAAIVSKPAQTVNPFNAGTTDEIPSGSAAKTERYR